MSEISNSIRQIRRTPLRSILFLVLVSLSASLLTLGVALYLIEEANMKRLEAVFVTIGLVSQSPDGSKDGRSWDAENQKYTTYKMPVYNGIVSPDALMFDGADYILPPKHRPYYGAYDPDLKYPDSSYIRLIAQTRTTFPIVVATPLEDCVPDHPVELKLLKELYGINGSVTREAGDWETVLFCDHYNPNPPKLYAGKTYVMALQWKNSHRDWAKTHTGVDAMRGEFAPRSDGSDYNDIVSTQYTPDGRLIPDEKPLANAYEEVTDGFFDTPEGQRWLELVKAMDIAEHTYPVIPTDNTQLLMSFYNGNASIVDGRDITAEEYSQGQLVCLISRQFAELNHYAVGDTLPVKLYYADYCDSASRDFPPDGLQLGNPNHLLNAKGKCYDVFEQHDYTVVGIYNEINQASYSSGYDMAGFGVVIPGASVKNSDANNILDYGPMEGFNTVFQIPNGSVEQYQALWNQVSGAQDGKESNVQITIYDKGYTQIKAGLLQIKQVAVALLVSGLLVTVLILLFFCNMFIGKQKRRTAIERSLGMGKRACTISLLTGVLAIVSLGSVIGSVAGYALSGGVMSMLSALSKSVSYSTEFSNWAQAAADVDQMRLVTGMVSPLVPLVCCAAIILIALVISLVQIRGNLRSEPLKLLSAPKM